MKLEYSTYIIKYPKFKTLYGINCTLKPNFACVI